MISENKQFHFLLISNEFSFTPPLTFLIMKMKTFQGKVSLPFITAIMCALVFISILQTERISSLSINLIIRLKGTAGYNIQEVAQTTTKSEADGRSDSLVDNNRAYNDAPNVGMAEADKKEDGQGTTRVKAEKCDVGEGKWVFKGSFTPLYSDRTCPYISRQYTCTKNGRPDFDYLRWEWQPDHCNLPRFDPYLVLKKLRGKRLLFVGDSIQRNQWESFVCMVESVIPDHQKSMKSMWTRAVFTAKEYNATVEFYWAPFLVESNRDVQVKRDPQQLIVRVNSVAEHAKHWQDVDFLVFNTYIWWRSGAGLKIKALWNSFENGGEGGYVELDAVVAYKIGIRTWANWIDSTINPNKTKVFFTTSSPTHLRSDDWNHKGGIKCFNETRPLTKEENPGPSYDKTMMNAVVDVVGTMKKVPVNIINITHISNYRVDGHASIYDELGGKLLTDEQKANPLRYADCIHWCLPGVPDFWNQIFLTYL